MLKDGIYYSYNHYEVYVDGVLKCTADNYSEARSDYFDYTGIRL